MAVKYSKAPISEVVCGIIFNSNFLLNNSILFNFLVELSKDFPSIFTHPTIAADEVVNNGIQTATEYTKAGFTTYRIVSEDTKWQVLAQQNLITFHWVRQDDENVGNYPGFTIIFERFKEIYSTLKRIVNDDAKFSSNIKHYYLSYSDRVNLEELKEEGVSITDTITLNPPKFEINNEVYKTDNYFNRYSGQCDAINGYSIVGVNSPTLPGLGQILVVDNKLKGAPKEDITIDQWFKVAHDIQVSFFETIFSPKILQLWK